MKQGHEILKTKWGGIGHPRWVLPDHSFPLGGGLFCPYLPSVRTVLAAQGGWRYSLLAMLITLLSIIIRVHLEGQDGVLDLLSAAGIQFWWSGDDFFLRMISSLSLFVFHHFLFLPLSSQGPCYFCLGTCKLYMESPELTHL